jgi:hypothetical protein
VELTKEQIMAVNQAKDMKDVFFVPGHIDPNAQ